MTANSWKLTSNRFRARCAQRPLLASTLVPSRVRVVRWDVIITRDTHAIIIIIPLLITYNVHHFGKHREWNTCSNELVNMIHCTCVQIIVTEIPDCFIWLALIIACMTYWERGRERGREGGRERGKEREGGREGGREREREKRGRGRRERERQGDRETGREGDSLYDGTSKSK